MAGGALSACGILLLTRTFLPATLRLVGRSGRRVRPAGRLAAANAHRNPGRAARTTAALMLGVGLIVTLQVGASSAQASLDRSFAERYPVDMAVTGSGFAPSPASVIAAVMAGGRDPAERRAPRHRYRRRCCRRRRRNQRQVMTILGVGDRAAAGASAACRTDLSDDSVIVPSYLLSDGVGRR